MKKFLIMLVSILMFSGCVSAGQFVPQANIQNRIDDPSKARIYVIRATAYGGAMAMEVKQDGEKIGVTKGKKYLTWETEPKKTVLTSKAENTSTLELDLEANNVYYVLQRVYMGVWSARNELKLVDESEGKSLLAKSSLSQTK